MPETPSLEPILALRQLVVEAIQKHRMDTPNAIRAMFILDDFVLPVDDSLVFLDGAMTFLECVLPREKLREFIDSLPSQE